MTEIKERRLQIRVTPSELDEINEAARELGLPTSNFVMLVLRQAIKDGVVVGKGNAPRGQSLVMVN